MRDFLDVRHAKPAGKALLAGGICLIIIGALYGSEWFGEPARAVGYGMFAIGLVTIVFARVIGSRFINDER